VQSAGLLTRHHPSEAVGVLAALPPCLVGIEACPTAHYWSRRLQALGHTVRLLPPSYVT
jgi:transposase